MTAQSVAREKVKIFAELLVKLMADHNVQAKIGHTVTGSIVITTCVDNQPINLTVTAARRRPP